MKRLEWFGAAAALAAVVAWAASPDAPERGRPGVGLYGPAKSSPPRTPEPRPSASRARRGVAPAFVDVTAAAGVGHRHHGPIVDERLRNVSQWFTAGGAGGAVGDFDNDGFEDIYVTDSRRGEPNALYHNEGGLRFTDVARAAGVADLNDEHDFSTMALFFDCDNDGWKDLLVARFGRSKLFRNRGDGTFEDVSDRLHMPVPRNPYAAVALDYDRDGNLDLYLGCYFPDVDVTAVGSTSIFQNSMEAARNGGTNVLLRNQGNCTFTDVTAEAGVGDTGWTLAVGSGDIDGDGWIDLYSANDYGPDKVYRNLGNGKFADVTERAIGVDGKAGMNAEFGDYDNDGWLDIFVTNITEAWSHQCNMFWHNNRDFTFSDVSEATGTCDTGWGWAGKFIDYDNDGWLDLYVMNGFISKGPEDYADLLMPYVLDMEGNLSDGAKWPPIGDRSFSGHERKALFHNNGRNGFDEVAAENGVASTLDGRGLLIADFDHDGAEDMYAINADANAILYRNVLGAKKSWMEIQLEGTKSNRDGLGTKLWFHTREGLRYRETNAGNGFEGQSSGVVHAGLGDVDRVDRIVVQWLDGTRQEFRDVPARVRYKLVEGGALKPIDGAAPPRKAARAPR